MDDTSYDWLKLVEKALLENKHLPALEEHFPFPWEEASEALQKSLEISELTLSCTSARWQEAHEFLKGMGEQPSVIAFELAPIEGSLFFILSQEDIAELTAAALTLDEESDGFSGQKLKQGFYHFLLLKVLQTLDGLSLLKGVSLHLLGQAPLPEESSFCIDVACTLSSRTLRGRLLCPQTFLDHFKLHQPFQKRTLFSLGKTSPLELSLRCEVGHTSLDPQEWDSLCVGDFLMLDRCSFDPTEEKGSLTVCLGNTPLFIARLKSDGLKVLDFALYQETPALEEDQETSFVEDEEEEDSQETAVDQEEKIEEPPRPPYEITAEVGHLQISLNDLLELKSGSMLQLPSRPEEGVAVTLGGKRVASAELLKLGQISGLRILKLEP